MKTLTLAPLALGSALLLCCLAPAADSPKPAPAPAADVQDFVFLGEARPVLVRLHVRLGGKSLQAAWDGCLDYLFGYLDVNKDGVLSKDEAERAPAVEQLNGGSLGRARFGGPRGGTPAPSGPSMEALDADKDGKITRAELAAWYRKNGFTPFQFRFGSAQANPLGGAAAIFGGPRAEPSVEAVSKAIFKLLDTDNDGKLSRAELEMAPSVLLRLDEDEDELITPQELVPDSGSPLGGIAGMIAMGRQGSREEATSSPKLVPVRTPGEVPADLVRRLFDRYAPAGASDVKKLGRKEMGLDEATFRRLDVNGDGLLDGEELGGFVKRSPDLELVMRLGKRGSTEAALEVVPGQGAPVGKLALRDSGALLDLGATRVELHGNDQDRPDRIGGFLRQQTLGQFRQADTNGDGVLDADEVQRSRAFRGLLKTVDRNGDGKIDEKELLAYLDHQQTLQERVTAGCVTLEISDQSRGLFDLLDVNRDGRLSVREMRRAPELAGARGYLAREDVPRTYRLEVRRGAANGGGPGDVGSFVERYLGGSGPSAPEPAGVGPRWFRRMDRNRDGDVSRREFLFGDELFRRLDTDGDGLISALEAEKAGALPTPEDKKDR